MTKVWDLGVRAFHWLLVSAVVVAAGTGLFAPRNWLGFHVAAGAVIGGLVAFRIVWGFTGSTYARFASFPFSPSAIAAQARGLLAGRHSRYFGHNPLGGVMVFSLLATLALLVATGVVTLGGVDKQGPLAFAISYDTGKAIRAIHQSLAYLLVAMVGGHLAGVIHESAVGGENLVIAMITGEKTSSTEATAGLSSTARPTAAALAVFLLLAGAAYGVVTLSARPAFGVPVGPLDPIYVKECGSCHMAYPPSLAPKTRWIALMAGLADHFGEDASLEPDALTRILTYLTDNAAEKWDTRPARELAASDPDDPLRITATRFWTRTHRGLPEIVFKSKAVRAKGACDACHSDALTGRFDPQNINVPELAFR